MYEEKPELMKQRTGLVHSHHGMDTYFSGTDTDELHEKAMNGLYLSLIVNNRWAPIAKLAWGGKVKRKIQSYWDWNTLGIKSKNEEEEEMDVVYELDLDVEIIGEPQNTLDRFDNLKKIQEKETYSFDRGRTFSNGKTIDDMIGGTHSDYNILGGSTRVGRQGKLFDEIRKEDEDPIEGESSVLEVFHQMNMWDAISGNILLGDLNFKGTFDEALTQFAEKVMKNSGEEDYIESITEAAYLNIKKGKVVVLDALGELFVTNAHYDEVVMEISDEMDAYDGRIAKAIQAGLDEYLSHSRKESDDMRKARI